MLSYAADGEIESLYGTAEHNNKAPNIVHLLNPTTHPEAAGDCGGGLSVGQKFYLIIALLIVGSYLCCRFVSSSLFCVLNLCMSVAVGVCCGC